MALVLAAATASEASDGKSGTKGPGNNSRRQAEQLEMMARQINEAEGYSAPRIMMETELDGGAGSPSIEDTVKRMNAADAWSCEGIPPRCERMKKDTKGVMYYETDTDQDHRGMATRWLGGPTLTMDNIWEVASTNRNNKRPPTATMTIPEGTTPVLKSGVHHGGKPYRMQWAFNGKPLYDHTNGMPDDGDRNHHTRFWIGDSFDMILENITSRDTGTFTAVYNMQGDGPMLETEIYVTVQYLPIPTIFSKHGQTKGITIKTSEEWTTATCISTLGEPRALMAWFKDGNRIKEKKITDDDDDRRMMKTITILTADIGALLTCRITSNFTNKVNTASVKVKSQETKGPLVQETKTKSKTTILQPIAVAMLTGAAILGITAGITGAMMLKRRWRDQAEKKNTREMKRGEPNTEGKEGV